jgi:hypothetical protein
MTASQWSHLDAALSFTRTQHPRTGASGLRYRSTRTSYLLRQPWSWPSAFDLTREAVPLESVGVAWYSEAIPFRGSSQSLLCCTTSELRLTYIVDVPPAAAVKRYQEKGRAVSCHMLLLICPSIHIHTPGFTSLALSHYPHPHDKSTLSHQHHRSASRTSQTTFHPSLLAIAIFSLDNIAQVREGVKQTRLA